MPTKEFGWVGLIHAWHARGIKVRRISILTGMSVNKIHYLLKRNAERKKKKGTVPSASSTEVETEP